MPAQQSTNELVTENTALIRQQIAEGFEQLLLTEDLSCKQVEYYLQVGQPVWKHGWIIHVSVISIQLADLLKEIVPILKTFKVSFRTAKDTEAAKLILNGNLGLLQLGKVISIYPQNGLQALTIAQALIPITQKFKGPDILTDKYLGGTLYCRYGNINAIISEENKVGIKHFNYENNNQSFKWPYTIPFELPEGIAWPFDLITGPANLSPAKSLEGKVKMLKVLKADARGNVSEGLWLEKWWKIRNCVIKEGKYAMVTDDVGRDIQYRLEWQYRLHTLLYGKLPIPKVYAHFKEARDHYLVIESIKGISLNKVVGDIYSDRAWFDLTKKEQLQLIGFANQVVNIVNTYHEIGYVHRDINPGNFLVKKDGQLVLIDLELSYSLKAKEPTPPLRYGTTWFMSPEQQAVLSPTKMEDIYAVGATILVLLTGLLPSKFATDETEIALEQLGFFIPNEQLNKVVLKCFRTTPTDRPTLQELATALVNFSNHLQQQPAENKLVHRLAYSQKEVACIVEEFLGTLTSSIFSSKEGLWFSKTIQNEEYAYYQMDEYSVYPGLAVGISGICCLLSQLHVSGHSIRNCLEHFGKGISYIQNIDTDNAQIGSGLYLGRAGIAIALSMAINANLTKEEFEVAKIIYYLKAEKEVNIGIATGLAGTCLAALQCLRVTGNQDLLDVIEQQVKAIESVQAPDGSWTTTQEYSSQKIFGYSHGVAGILYALLGYTKYIQNDKLLCTIDKGLKWLISHAIQKNGKYMWPYSDKNKTIYPGLSDGLAGIGLLFIKAYEVLRVQKYKLIAEGILANFPDRLCARDLSLGTGATGVGEVYLEAFNVLGDEKWKQRADWISAFLLNQCRRLKGHTCHWIIDESSFSTADLINGNTGLLYYIIRSSGHKEIFHPLFLK